MNLNRIMKVFRQTPEQWFDWFSVDTVSGFGQALTYGNCWVFTVVFSLKNPLF